MQQLCDANPYRKFWPQAHCWAQNCGCQLLQWWIARVHFSDGTSWDFLSLALVDKEVADISDKWKWYADFGKWTRNLDSCEGDKLAWV